MIEHILYSPTSFGATVQDNFTILLDLDQSCIGKPSKEVKAAVKHLCGLATPDMDVIPITTDNYYDLCKEYFAKIESSDPTGDQLLIFLLLFSSFFHEMRHAHDLMSTTFGQDMLFRLMNFYQNTPALLMELSKWLEDDGKRRVPLPLKDHFLECECLETLHDLFEKYKSFLSVYGRREGLTKSSFLCSTATSLLEASAVDIQLGFVCDVFGERAALLLLFAIQRSERARIYLRLRNDLRDIFLQNGYKEDRVGSIINHLVWLSLMGTTFPGKGLGDGPTSVAFFEGLVEHVAVKSRCQDVENVEKAANEFCSRWGLLTPAQMNNKVSEVLREREKRLRSRLEELPEGNSLNMTVDAYSSFVSSFFHVHDLVSRLPDAYFGQRLYGWLFLYGNLPRLHVKVRDSGTSYDFMSNGKETISFDDWNLLCLLSAVFRFMMEGTSALRTFHDYMVRDHLINKGWGGTRLRFADRSGLFDQ